MSSTASSPSSRTDRRGAILAQAGKLEERPAVFFGQDVLVRELTAKQAREFQDAISNGNSYPIGYLLEMALIDPETREPLFEATDRQALEDLGMRELRPVLVVIKEQSGIDDDDLQKATQGLKVHRATR